MNDDGEPLCDRLGKPQALSFSYEPGTDVLTGQDEKKANVVGDPDDDDLAYIVVSSKKNGNKDDKTGKTYFAGGVEAGDIFIS